MPFKIEELQKAHAVYKQFKSYNSQAHHERFIFPFFAGSYFTYRKVDVMRVITISKSISNIPKFIDIGCGYGDFLEKIREFIPDAIGLEQDGSIFYAFQKTIPDFIYSTPIEAFEKKMFDVAFIGWMEPGVDFRKYVAAIADTIITTFDTGGQCGINSSCEYEEFGFKKIASWRTPSWIDVNSELMNKFYTPSLLSDGNKKQQLAKLRTAHNFWYVYTRPHMSCKIIAGLKEWLKKEESSDFGRYEFESILDECGFHYKEDLPMSISKFNRLWEVSFD
jgi:hypothetical protein